MQKETGVKALARARVVGLDSTHLVKGHSGSGRRELYVLVTLDGDGRIVTCGTFLVKDNTRKFICRALRAIREKLEDVMKPEAYRPDMSFFVDECRAGTAVTACCASLSGM